MVAASVLAKLNKLNSNLRGHQVKKGKLKVPYTMFYIPQLADKIDIRFDYMRWAHADLNGPSVSINFHMCVHGFLNLVLFKVYYSNSLGPGFLFL